MNVLAPQISNAKAMRDRMINYLASFLPDTPLPPPPGIPANVLADPGTWQGAGREALNFLVPQPEDSLMMLNNFKVSARPIWHHELNGNALNVDWAQSDPLSSVAGLKHIYKLAKDNDAKYITFVPNKENVTGSTPMWDMAERFGAKDVIPGQAEKYVTIDMLENLFNGKK